MKMPKDRLDSWKEVANYIGKDVRTAMRWEKTRGMPVHRIPGGTRSSVYAFISELDTWLQIKEPETRSTDLDIRSQNAGALFKSGDWGQSQVEQEEKRPQPNKRKEVWKVSALVLLLAGATLAFTWARIRSPFASPKLQFGNEILLTSDDFLKRGLLTDGREIYFSEYRDARAVLSAIPATGGEVRTLPAPGDRAFPMSISPDGSHLLAVTFEGEEKDRPLWSVPTHSGTPMRVGDILCHSAAWSPSGKFIAFARGNSVYVTDSEGKSQVALGSFAGIPRDLHWWPDGQKLRLQVHDVNSSSNAFWDLEFSSPESGIVTDLRPLHVNLQDCCLVTSAVFGESGMSLISGGDPETNPIRILARKPSLLRPGYTVTDAWDKSGAVQEVAVDPAHQRVYAARSTYVRYEMMRIDRNSKKYSLFLPGVSGIEADLSRTGGMVVFVRMLERELWIANSDGSQMRRLSPASISGVELPRWSPDGQWIAFMAKEESHPFRIYLIRPDGTGFHVASVGNDNQGAPTWSPDGRTLYYGQVRCEEMNNCTINQIDIGSSKQSQVPNSKGLTTARVSPNGRFLAALRADQHQVYICDPARGDWKLLASGMSGNDLAWSMDSRFVYAGSINENHPTVMRIRVPDGFAERAFDLTEFSRLAGILPTWFTVTPDDSLIFVRMATGDQLIEMDYVMK